jgi:hypothetical protein
LTYYLLLPPFSSKTNTNEQQEEEHETRKTHPSVNFIWWDRAAPLGWDGASLENGQGPISKKTKKFNHKKLFLP